KWQSLPLSTCVCMSVQEMSTAASPSQMFIAQVLSLDKSYPLRLDSPPPFAVPNECPEFPDCVVDALHQSKCSPPSSRLLLCTCFFFILTFPQVMIPGPSHAGCCLLASSSSSMSTSTSKSMSLSAAVSSSSSSSSSPPSSKDEQTFCLPVCLRNMCKQCSEARRRL
ncbi:mCG144585, partial [Mus musculus]